ncbi:hypothetical protein M9Y10_019845 [Tritrichomonas musculus]|uniref:Surface antigen BspA-like n=1 Tax=Tritrichomonas musculus TaxID=1915356 RepID=A0ABR2HHF7_9EUKA
MEVENTQERTFYSEVVKIPIEEYEEDMNTEASKEKKKAIIDLITNYNNIRSEEEYEEIKYYLHVACKGGDLELIKIYLSETIANDSKSLIFKIDKLKHTASLFKIDDNISSVVIPRTIELESTEYLITSICGSGMNIRTFEFEQDSAVETIYGYIFFYMSPIENIYFPPSLKELKKEWCLGTNNLTKITISPLNGQFIMKDDKYLLGKSDPNKDEFDILLFVRRDIKEVSIPSNIKIISTCAFGYCNNITKFEIQSNSNLQIIEKFAFCESNIKEISIPSTIKIISSYAFQYCTNLTKVEIPSNSNLQIIEKDAFYELSIKEISIPPEVSIIRSGAFYNCRNLTKVEIPPNSKLQTIESKAFARTKIKEIYFPTSLKELKEGWNCDITNLVKITISPSNGQFIMKDDKYLLGKSDPNKDEFDILLFVRRDIKEISIPSNIKIISSYALEDCNDLTKVEIQSNSNLQRIEKYAFYKSNINEIFIPSEVSIICSGAFFNCNNLTKVEFETNSKLQTIESEAFRNTNIDEIFIPPEVSIIRSGAFYNCKNLIKVEIPPNSKLQTIESEAFAGTKIKEIYFPTSLKELKEGWNCEINNLAKIIISPSNGQFIFKDDKYLLGKSDPNKDEFDILLFACRDIKEISIPSNIKIISSYALEDCNDLTKVEIQSNSNLQRIEKYAFNKSNIKEIFIPSTVSIICYGAFYYCFNLTKVEFETNSNLQTIESNAFSLSNINSIIIPSKVSKIHSDAFLDLQIIEISEDSELESFPLSNLRYCSNFLIMIPSTLKKLIHDIRFH